VSFRPWYLHTLYRPIPQPRDRRRMRNHDVNEGRPNGCLRSPSGLFVRPPSIGGLIGVLPTGPAPQASRQLGHSTWAWRPPADMTCAG